MYICYCPLRDPNWNKILYCIEACFSNRHDLNTDLNNLSTKILSKHCISKEINSVVCLACIFSKCLS